MLAMWSYIRTMVGICYYITVSRIVQNQSRKQLNNKLATNAVEPVSYATIYENTRVQV